MHLTYKNFKQDRLATKYSTQKNSICHFENIEQKVTFKDKLVDENTEYYCETYLKPSECGTIIFFVFCLFSNHVLLLI